MDLATHQRKLLRLIRGSYHPSDDDDPYIRRVATSPDLHEARRNIALWRIWVFQRTCPLTFKLLTARGLLGEAVNAFMEGRNISPFRETQTPAFLEFLSRHHDAVVRSIAQFEAAMLRVRQGDETSYTVGWTVEPLSLLNSLVTDQPMRNLPEPGRYDMVVSHDLPGLFAVVQEISQ